MVIHAKGGLSIILIASAAGQAAPECKQFQEIYAGGKELCENMWTEAFKYETDEDKGYNMWFYEATNPNTAVSERLFGAEHAEPDVCHLDYYHKDAPGPEPEGYEECLPWKENACCHKDTVSTAQKLKEGYGEEYHWDRCGPLSPACERFFVMEACFYECEPAAGLFRRYPASDFTAHDREGHIEYDPSCDEYHASYDSTKDCSHNSWELYRMPIKASFCDAWYTACKHDYFCAADGGNFFSCAEQYEAERNFFRKKFST